MKLGNALQGIAGCRYDCQVRCKAILWPWVHNLLLAGISQAVGLKGAAVGLSDTWARHCHALAPWAWARRSQSLSWRCPTVRGSLQPTSRLCSMLGADPSYSLHRRKKGKSWAQFPYFSTASCPRSKLKLPPCS